MPRMGFEPENVLATTNFDFPKFKLVKGEQARILLLETPVMEYVHTLNKPIIINGVPKMETKKKKNGDEYVTYATSFVTKALCLGDATILKETGSDPKNCPMCKLAKDFPDYTKPPQRRFAMHVVRYGNKPGTFDLSKPFSVEVLVWSFTDVIFAKITAFKKEWDDLRKHDLLCGPCSDADWQKFDISVAKDAAWLENPENKARVIETWKGNQIPDLTIAVGSVKQRTWILQDIETVMEAWAQVSGAETAAASTSSLDDDLNDLLGKSVTETVEDEIIDQITGEVTYAADSDDLLEGLDDAVVDETVGEDVDIDELLADQVEEDPAPVVKAAPKAAPKAAVKAAVKAAPAVKAAAPVVAEAAEEVDNFDDLLADL